VAFGADDTPPERRSARFGILESAFGLGFIVGPAIGGLLGSWGLRVPFWAAAVLCLANALFGFLALPESLARERRAAFSWRRANPLSALAILRRHPELAGLSLTVVLMSFAHASLPNLIVLYMSYRYGWGERAVGLAVTAIGASAALVGLWLVGRVVAKIGDRRTLLLGLAGATLGFVLYASAYRAELFVAGIFVMALWGLATAPLQTLMTRRVGPDEQGRLQGALTGLRCLAGMAAPLFFGWLFSRTIGPRAVVNLPGAVFFVAALGFAGAYVVAARATRPRGNERDVAIRFR
jgi:DHA1 family tetracycline resistance protein-like MFS transporter